MTYLMEKRTAVDEMNVMSKIDRAISILEKLFLNCTSFLFKTTIHRMFPMIPIRTVIGVTITSIMAGNVNSIVISVNIQNADKVYKNINYDNNI